MSMNTRYYETGEAQVMAKNVDDGDYFTRASSTDLIFRINNVRHVDGIRASTMIVVSCT